MVEEVLQMSTKELERYSVLDAVRKKTLTQDKAAELLGITDRQVRNLLTLLTNKGPHGLISQKRGRASNRTKPSGLQAPRSLDCSREVRRFWSIVCQGKIESSRDRPVTRQQVSSARCSALSRRREC